MKRTTAAGLAVILIVMSYFGYKLLQGPRMDVQPHIRAYQAQMPPTPSGIVPRNDSAPPAAPTAQQAITLTTRPATPQDLAAGGAYYSYYACLACHGPAGDGRGPVGESYVPLPADLRTPRVAALSDGALLRAMLTGPGHQPVMEHTILAEHRWPLVHYVRSLAVGAMATTQPSAQR